MICILAKDDKPRQNLERFFRLNRKIKNKDLVLTIHMPEKTGTKKLFETSYLIGIGASAGGLDAINEMFENMPENTGFSFVIIQHISPDYKSLMAELVAKHTAMPVVEATDEMLVLPNHVYVIPSKKVMTLKFGKLHLQEKEKTKSPNNAIDVFFESLAEDAGEYAVGVILSGTGTDGTRGLEAIKNKGGFIAVQEPITAAFDGMPNSAIATGKADMIVSPERMGDELLEFLNEPPEIKAFHARSQKDELLLRDLLLLIKNRTGHDFGYYKRPTICRRLAKRLSELGIPEIRTYLAHIERHPEELSVISKDFLINVSGFFRDKEAFDIVATRVIPTIVKNKVDDDTIKAWCVACSTGEEAYSLAILFKEALERSNRKNLIVKIFATDIDRDALEIASRGFYPKTISQDIPANRLARYFLPEENGYRIHPDIRKMVVFSYHDILKDPPFGRMDLVSCRNMLIYINPSNKRKYSGSFILR
jgi:two-component system CheB/CheR fusion protein